jgi:Semialdehyde dehydrogenase, NAD binding domain
MSNISLQAIAIFPRRSAVSVFMQQLRMALIVIQAFSAQQVGQHFILLLALHPHFELHAVGVSERSADKKYKNAVKWKQALPFTERIGDSTVKQCMPDEFKDCDR